MTMLEILAEHHHRYVPTSVLRSELIARDCPNDHAHIGGSAKYLRNAGFNVVATKGRNAGWCLDPPAEATRQWNLRLLKESYSCEVRAHRSLSRMLAGPPSDDTALLHQIRTMVVGAVYALGGMSGIDNKRIQSDLRFRSTAPDRSGSGPWLRLGAVCSCGVLGTDESSAGGRSAVKMF
jgi:hypothetical protein